VVRELRLKPRIAYLTGLKRTPKAPSIADLGLDFPWFAHLSNCMAAPFRSNLRPVKGPSLPAYSRSSKLQSELRHDRNRFRALVRVNPLH
jgi:hypothetical protein